MQPVRTEEVTLDIESVQLHGQLAVPSAAKGVVVFAHGSGSGRNSPRNRYVAWRLQEAGLATLLIDLLTDPEAQDRRNVFDIPLLAERVAGAARWLGANPSTAGMPVGAFGASTGGGAALMAAAKCPEVFGCVVSRGGRPDLAEEALPAVRCPTLLIVGGEDTEVLALNQAAQDRMTAECELAVVPGATHLFEEPGMLEQVADLATDWFTQNLTSREEG